MIDEITLICAARGDKAHHAILADFVYRTAASVLTPSAPDVEDAIQVTLFRLYRAVNSGAYTPTGGSAKRYVRVTAVRAAIDQRKRRSETWRCEVEQEALEAIGNETEVDPAEALDWDHLRTLLPELMHCLTEEERAVILLVGDGLSTREIAEELNIREGTVKSRQHRAVAKLSRRARGPLHPLS